MEYKIIDGKRFHIDESRRSKLVWVPSEKYLYSKINQRNGKIEYICYQHVLADPKKKNTDGIPRCRARVALYSDGTLHRNSIEHTAHRIHEAEYEDMRSVYNMKMRCNLVHTEFPESSHNIAEKSIFYKELASRNRDQNRSKIRSKLIFKKMKRSLNKIKNSARPKIPQGPAELRLLFKKPDVFAKYGYNLDQTAPFYVDTIVQPQFSFCVFKSHSIIGIIKENIDPTLRHYLIDGTFSCVPPGFYQVLIISIEYHNDVFPIAYVLMTKKTTSCYTAVFNFIEKEIFPLYPAEFMTDFEAGLRKALVNVYPNARIRGCWFHYCDALRKKSRALGMYRLIRQCSNAKMIMKMLKSLPLLPSHNFQEGYDQIKSLSHELELLGNFKQFFLYFESYWIAQNRSNELSVTNLNMRTISSVESMNSQFKRSFKRHGNIFKFIECLGLHEFTKATEMWQLLDSVSSNQLERKKSADKEREKKIKYFTSKLIQKEIDVHQFLVAMSNKTSLTDK